jgi:hypothetical protein
MPAAPQANAMPQCCRMQHHRLHHYGAVLRCDACWCLRARSYQRIMLNNYSATVASSTDDSIQRPGQNTAQQARSADGLCLVATTPYIFFAHHPVEGTIWQGTRPGSHTQWSSNSEPQGEHLLPAIAEGSPVVSTQQHAHTSPLGCTQHAHSPLRMNLIPPHPDSSH